MLDSFVSLEVISLSFSEKAIIPKKDKTGLREFKNQSLYVHIPSTAIQILRDFLLLLF